MLRFSALIVLLSMLIIPTSAIDMDIEIVEVQLNENQRVRIVPLYQDFDFFYELITGEIVMSDLPRRERFIAACYEDWYDVADDFGIEIPETLPENFVEDYRQISEEIPDSVIEIVIETLTDSALILPAEDIIVCLDPVYSDERWASGLAFGGRFTIFLANWGEDDDEMTSALRNIISHEYHHHARFSNPNTRYSGAILLETLVTEGMATYFQTLVYPEDSEAWLPNLDEEEFIYAWSVIEPQFRSLETETHRDYLFGRIDDLPNRAGYAIGYEIMLAFAQNNPDITVEEWTTMPSQEIYDLSGYQPPITED